MGQAKSKVTANKVIFVDKESGVKIEKTAQKWALREQAKGNQFEIISIIDFNEKSIEINYYDPGQDTSETKNSGVHFFKCKFPVNFMLLNFIAIA